MKTWLHRTIGAALLAGATVSASAQMSLSTAVDLALKSDPRVKMAEASVKKAEAVVSEAKDVYIPNVGVKGSGGASTGVPLSVPVVFSLSSESLLFNFSLKDNLRAANDGLHAAKLALLDAQAQASEDAVVTYLNLDNAERRHEAFTDQSGFAHRLVLIVQQRLDAGQDTRMDLLKAQRSDAQIHLALINNQDEIDSLTQHMGMLLGLPGTRIVTEPASVPALPGLASLPLSNEDGYGVQAAFATAQSKQEVAFGESRYTYRPQVSFGANYSRITTALTDYTQYYPGFNSKHSDNAISLGIEISIPILDYEHNAHARESQADAAYSLAEAENNRLQFIEGRAKLRRSMEALSAKGEVARLDREIAQEQLDTILIQISSSSSDPNSTMMTPKDEQNARLQERQKAIDLLTAQQELQQTEINLMRQNGTLGEWLQKAVHDSVDESHGAVTRR